MRSLREVVIDLIEALVNGDIDKEKLEDLLQELYDGDV